MFGKITQGSNDEIELIKNYKYTVTTDGNTYSDFYNYLISKGYQHQAVYEQSEIRNFYKVTKLNDSIEKFIEILEFLLLNKINPYFENITFNSIVTYTSEVLIVKFNIVKSYD